MNDEYFLNLNSPKLNSEDKVLSLDLSCTIAKRLYKSLDDSIKDLLMKCGDLGGRLAIITEQDGLILIIECPNLELTHAISKKVENIKAKFKEITGSLKMLFLFYKGSGNSVCFGSPGNRDTGEWQFFRDKTKK
jgi:hypothetical protein